MKGHGNVFVYGTLKEGGSLSNGFDEMRVAVRPAKVKGVMYNLSNFPGAVLGGKDYIYGELHTYSDFRHVVKRMDYIEGCDGRKYEDHNLYNRRVVEVETENGKKVRALMYVFNTARIKNLKDREIVKNGTWPLVKEEGRGA